MTVSIVTMNCDFTEGRGPMKFHKVFANRLDAESWVKKQPGIFGSKQYKKPESYHKNIFVWNGYDIHTNVEVE